MRKKQILIIGFIAFFIGFYGCNVCDNHKEPTIRASFSCGIKVINVAALDANRPLENFSKLPINLSLDYTIYVVESIDGFDTLCIGYDRMFNYESKECGATISIRNMHVLPGTTFSNVVIESNQVFESNQLYYEILIDNCSGR